MIQMSCVKCGMILNVPDSASGRQVECKQCHTIQAVPAGKPKMDSIFGEIRYNGSEIVELRFRQMFQALLKQEQQAPALDHEQLVSA